MSSTARVEVFTLEFILINPLAPPELFESAGDAGRPTHFTFHRRAYLDVLFSALKPLHPIEIRDLRRPKRNDRSSRCWVARGVDKVFLLMQPVTHVLPDKKGAVIQGGARGRGERG